MQARSPHCARRVRARTRKIRGQRDAEKASLTAQNGTKSQLDEKFLGGRSGQTAHWKTSGSEPTNRIDTVILPSGPATPASMPEPCSDGQGYAAPGPHRPRLASCAHFWLARKARRAAPAGSLSGDLSTLHKRGSFYFALTLPKNSQRPFGVELPAVREKRDNVLSYSGL